MNKIMTYFNMIVMDPPWKFSDRLSMSDVRRGAEANYSTLTLQEIKDLPIEKLADPDGCILALWCPSSLIKEGLEVMSAYGFTFKQTYIWVRTKKQKSLTKDIRKGFIELIKKVGRKAIKLDGSLMTFKDFDYVLDETVLDFGMGRLFRQTHEICLIGTNNNKIYKK